MPQVAASCCTASLAPTLTRSPQLQRPNARAAAGVRSQHVVYQRHILSYSAHREAAHQDASSVETFLALEEVQVCYVHGSSCKND